MEPGGEATAAQKWVKENGLYWHEDMLVPIEVDPSLLGRIKSFDFDKSDVLISTYPRSGTTWSQELTWLICNNVDVATAEKVDYHIRSPCIEFYYPKFGKPDVEILETSPPPRVIKTHFTPQYFETQRQAVGFKTIVVMRNLKDVLVSHFHFYKDCFVYDFEGTWDDFFEMFKQDNMLYGSWVKHCLKCWELRDDPTVLMLKYEDMKKDPPASIRKMARFCGKTLSDDQVTTIADFAGFGKMRKRGAAEEEHVNFFRKGVVGEWEAFFTEEQLKYVDNLLKTTTEKEGIFFDCGSAV